ncbi:Lar family restriction alleviation protein [Anaerovibrio sp. RM50]|uniref:Lar family restriction alleviation protein n=1 Tax=Anaerovibrio sp. RM50 TaxID=1200557 RepID=UPI00047FDBF1|nr:Lar family restriction alleviation protein [Anaerovibrio sp. RM50]
MTELKPCPFCGAKALIDIIPAHRHSEWLRKQIPDLPDCEGEAFVECTGCTAMVAGDTPEKAIAEWNRRTQ